MVLLWAGLNLVDPFRENTFPLMCFPSPLKEMDGTDFEKCCTQAVQAEKLQAKGPASIALNETAVCGLSLITPSSTLPVFDRLLFHLFRPLGYL